VVSTAELVVPRVVSVLFASVLEAPGASGALVGKAVLGSAVVSASAATGTVDGTAATEVVATGTVDVVARVVVSSAGSAVVTASVATAFVVGDAVFFAFVLEALGANDAEL